MHKETLNATLLLSDRNTILQSNLKLLGGILQGKAAIHILVSGRAVE